MQLSDFSSRPFFHNQAEIVNDLLFIASMSESLSRPLPVVSPPDPHTQLVIATASKFIAFVAHLDFVAPVAIPEALRENVRHWPDFSQFKRSCRSVGLRSTRWRASRSHFGALLLGSFQFLRLFACNSSPQDDWQETPRARQSRARLFIFKSDTLRAIRRPCPCQSRRVLIPLDAAWTLFVAHLRREFSGKIDILRLGWWRA